MHDGTRRSFQDALGRCIYIMRKIESMDVAQYVADEDVRLAIERSLITIG